MVTHVYLQWMAGSFSNYLHIQDSFFSCLSLYAAFDFVNEFGFFMASETVCVCEKEGERKSKRGREKAKKAQGKEKKRRMHEREWEETR